MKKETKIVMGKKLWAFFRSAARLEPTTCKILKFGETGALATAAMTPYGNLGNYTWCHSKSKTKNGWLKKAHVVTGISLTCSCSTTYAPQHIFAEMRGTGKKWSYETFSKNLHLSKKKCYEKKKFRRPLKNFWTIFFFLIPVKTFK